VQYDEEYLTSYRSIFRYTAAIVHRDKHGKPAFGSGVLIDIGDKRFVATAHHCIREAVLWLEGMDIPRDERLPSPKVPVLNKGGDGETDVGFMEIPKGALLKTAIEQEACTLDQVYTDAGDKAGWPIHICGWPQYGVRRLGADTIERSLEGIMVQCVGADDKYLRFEFADTARGLDERGEWVIKPTPSPKGYSGGGCWAITKSKDDELYIPMRNTKLVALQSAWDGERFGWGPLIGEWISVINKHYPGLTRLD
jgi:hypothetical protein